ncbi:DUF4158 domain-containing protein [Kitasatospora sp. NPDC056273]|uniref:DUF4158 domain-containing protein n=1 Tax=Kitasatospora sp. NPDC056273 TaxID=3345769 RepID=UPI0035D9C679
MESKRRAHNRLGFAARLTTVRYLGVFPGRPGRRADETAKYPAEHLDIEDASLLEAHGERENTRLDTSPTGL